jgi:hypothetical protein
MMIMVKKMGKLYLLVLRKIPILAYVNLCFGFFLGSYEIVKAN